GFRKELRALAEEPVQFALATEEDAAQDQAGDDVRVGNGVGQPQRAAPGAAEHQPALYIEMPPQLFDVGDQMVGGVVARFAEWRAAPAAALIQQDNAIVRGIEEAALVRIAAATRPAVQENHRSSSGIPTLLE